MVIGLSPFFNDIGINGLKFIFFPFVINNLSMFSFDLLKGVDCLLALWLPPPPTACYVWARVAGHP